MMRGLSVGLSSCLLCASILAIAVLACLKACAFEPAALVFEKDVPPVLAAECGKCHGEQAREANLDWRSVAAILRGGDSGAPITKGDAQDMLDSVERAT